MCWNFNNFLGKKEDNSEETSQDLELLHQFYHSFIFDTSWPFKIH